MVFDYTPTEYEVAFKQLFESLLADQFGHPVKVEHDIKLLGDSGQEHQIDAMATVSVAGFEIKIIVECKRYSENVSIDRILTLKSRMDDTNVHKGIIVAPTGFQKGTRTFAESKGIALAIFEPDPAKLDILVLSDNAEEFMRKECLYQGLLVCLRNATQQVSSTVAEDEDAV